MNENHSQLSSMEQQSSSLKLQKDDSNESSLGGQGSRNMLPNGIQDKKWGISNSDELIQLIAENQLFSCRKCHQRLITTQCSKCGATLCSECASPKHCPVCRQRPPIFSYQNLTPRVNTLVEKARINDLSTSCFEDTLLCQICSQLVTDPKQCPQCTAQFCLPCIQNRLVKEDRCPSCRK